MYALKNPQMNIPGGGYDFRQPEINWHAHKVLGLHPSLAVIVPSLISARKAHPHLITKHKWSVDFNSVMEEVKQFNVKRCLANGWMNYLTEGGGSGAPPFNKAQSLLNQKQLGAAVEKVKRLWAGLKTLNDWLDSGEPPVEQDHSEKRAAVCVECPLNGQGDFSSWFTVPASGAIKRQLERLEQRKIFTSQDAKLNVCTACLCPLKVKVQTPMKFIKPHLLPEVIEDLKGGKNCWLLAEIGV